MNKRFQKLTRDAFSQVEKADNVHTFTVYDADLAIVSTFEVRADDADEALRKAENSARFLGYFAAGYSISAVNR